MRRQLRKAFPVGLLATLASLLAPLLAPALASAQDSVLESTKTPNVLLLVDTSGSMEYKVGLTGGVPVYPSCTAPDYERSRWIELVEVLAGSIPDYACQSIDRSASSFLSEYELPFGQAPLDYQYRNPYHRPLSGTCAIGPDLANIDPNAYRWSPPKEYDTGTGLACTFNPNGDGIIDSFGTNVRFGLMTFDTMPDESTGVSGTSADYTEGLRGAWSYWVGSHKVGNPVECASAPMEVGARNPAALPWEGKMIPFGAQSPTSLEDAQRHDYIRKVLLTTRPYGATPIAGMLDDAFDFLTVDNENDPDTYIAPRADSFVDGGCRKQFVILLTDGEPNLDLREECQFTSSTGPDGECPYKEPEEIAEELNKAGIMTYVIGFSPTDIGTDIHCDEMDEDDVTSPTGRCNDTTGVTGSDLRELQACCRLHSIAFKGGGRPALFAESGADLREELNVILNEVLSGMTHSRTRPVLTRAGAIVGEAPALSYRFLSGLQVSGAPGQVWDGKLERQRYICNEGVPEAVDIDRSKGDDFVYNLNQNGPSARTYYTFTGSDLSDYHADQTIRPGLTTTDPDGLGLQGGTDVRGNATELLGLVGSEMMRVDTSQSNCSGLNEAACAARVLSWTIGLDDGYDLSTNRWRAAGDGNLMGDIHHSMPRIVDRPDAIIQDQSYTNFMEAFATRPQMLYTSSNDGFLHGFKVRPNGASGDAPIDSATSNPEVFAYIPPAVLTRLQMQFPGTHQRLLDGEPIVKDVIATEVTPNVFAFERSAANSKLGATSEANTWRTVLVQSFGGAWPGYFALDITDPVYKDGVPGSGPRLLWQITTAKGGVPLFGNGGTPLITTIFDSVLDKEIAVAVLPGGNGGSPTSTVGNREGGTNFPQIEDSAFAVRTQLHKYPPAASPARSLTIVRLDNGQILRTFRADDSIVTALGAANPEGTAFAAVRAPAPYLDSPITGRPVAFPSEVGAVADRIFVGDQDGTLWRVDVSGASPAAWTMDLFFDAYAPEVGVDATAAPTIGQPIATPPILSVDDRGNITVNFSTGDQEAVDVNGTVNYLWSLTEVLDGADFKTRVNWYERFTGGKRVLGPMVLLQGDLYFATYTPATTATACGNPGTSTITAYNYVRPKTLNDNDEGAGGERIQSFDDPELDFAITGIEGAVFGVTVGQEPSCNAAASDDPTESPYFGNYTKPTTSLPTAGLLKVMYHTSDAGKRDPLGANNAVGVGSATVRSPPSVSRITSWAAIVE